MSTQKLPDMKLTRVIAAASAGTSTLEPAAPLDMQGFEGVIFFTNATTGAADNVLKAQQGDESDGSDAADLADSGVAMTANGMSAVVEVNKPTKRYVQPAIVRGTSTATQDCWAIQYGAGKKPTDNDIANTIASVTLSGPAEGTA